MNALRFGEDVEAVLTWINEPVLLYGHSAGAAGSIIAASRHPDQVKLLFLEGCYARTKEALRSLYRNFNLFFGLLFGPVIVFWMDLFYRFQMDGVSPVRLAPNLQMPVLIIHGENDRNFPLHHAKRLLESFVHGNAELFVAEGADHSGSSQAPRFSETIRRFVEQHLPARQHCHDIML
jgi:pimeloyl-ACP methyl ester carboxylesterase